MVEILKMKSSISVIVPVYNVPEEFLRRCLKSIADQSLKNIEIIVVDDGSTDESGAICDLFAENDKRFRVIHKQNEGLASARNTGFFYSCSKWIMFVDGDDYIDKEMCKVMLESAEENAVQIVMCGMMKEYCHSSVPYKYILKDKKVYVGEECKWLQEQLLHYNSNIATAYCKLIERDLLLKNNIQHDSELRQGMEGIEFNIRLFGCIEKALFLNRPFYHYIYNDSSISASHNEQNHTYVILCLNKIKNEILESENKEKLLYWLYNRVLYVIITTAVSGYFSANNSERYAEKKKKFTEYLKQNIIQEALFEWNIDDLSLLRKFILFVIKNKWFFVLNIIGRLRNLQKKIK